MELGLGNTLLAGDPRLVDHIVGEVKSQGIFDQFRKECIADVDTKPAYQNLRTRVESSVNSFLGKQAWKADLNKNQLRETLRKHIHEAPYLDAGVERIVDQVVNPKVYSVFMPQIEDVVYKFLGLERPKTYRQRNGGSCGFKDLLPKDLDPVSPESDKNSLRDVSLDSVDANIDDNAVREVSSNASCNEKNIKDENTSERESAGNGESNEAEKFSEDTLRPSVVSASYQNINNSGKSEDNKPDEEEEDSPMFEPIDIMNLNESNISNDSHLSGISELTSHRSQSPDISNDTSREIMDFSNQDSQFSKVSSDSRLSIVTDFGSSNHASTPIPDVPKDDTDKNDGKYARDNFKAVREFETAKIKDGRSSSETLSCKQEAKVTRPGCFASKETSRDATEMSRDFRESKEKIRLDGESARIKSSKETRKERDYRKKSVAEPKNERIVKRQKDKTEFSRDNSASKEQTSTKPRDERIKDPERKDIAATKEIKDLKDIYKEKIRELREKKELTEKERLSKETRLCKETREKGDASRDPKKDSKDHKSSAASKGHSSSRTETKASRTEAKGSRSESRDKGKRDEGKYSKQHRSRTTNSQASVDSSDKIDGKRSSKNDKDDKTERSDVKQDSRQKIVGKSSKNDCGKNSEGKRDSKGEIEAKDGEKKRRSDKKSKIKDDHSSLRKNSDDRRSTDRDGSNGSNGKGTQKNNSGTNAAAAKPASSGLSKESTTTSNSSSETSDSIEEKQNEKLLIYAESKNSQIVRTKGDEDAASMNEDFVMKKLDVGQAEISLPIKKRPLLDEGACGVRVAMKKPKFAKNFQEAKRLMKIRRRMERENIKRQLEIVRNVEPCEIVEIAPKSVVNDLQLVPDDERVQIIEVRDEEYDEPYPEIQSDFTLEERSQIILGGESLFTSDVLAKRFNGKSTLSEMEQSIRQSLKEMMSDSKIEETKESSIKPHNSLEPDTEAKIQESSRISEEDAPNLFIIDTKDSSNGSNTLSNVTDVVENAGIREISTKNSDDEKCTNADEFSCEIKQVESYKCSKSTTSSELTNLPSPMIDAIPKLEVAEETAEIIEIVEGKAKSKEIVEEETKIGDRIEEKTETNEIVEKIDASASTKIVDTAKGAPLEENERDPCYKFETKSEKKAPLSEDIFSYLSDDDDPCLYFIEDNAGLEKFTKFMKNLENQELTSDEHPVEILSNEIVSSVTIPMAPPKPKRKYSTSPLTDILLNNANNNNDAHKIIEPVSDVEDGSNSLKKRKIGRPKKSKNNASLCSQQNLSNGENFVMPLSPESDVSATSEKTPSNPMKDEKSRPRGSNQRYTSDDLYKPRPLFSSSSRRSRRSNQA